MHERPSATRDISAGSRLLFYTDGLIDNRLQAIDEGITAVHHTFGAGADLSVETLADVLASREGAGHDDDQCLLLVRVLA